MRSRRLIALATLLAPLIAVPALGQTYLPSGAAMPDATRYLAPPPAARSPVEAGDRMVFRQTRRLKHSDRWRLATGDAKASPQDILSDFGCALGVQLDQHNAPTLVSLFTRTARDIRPVIDPPKDLYKRHRPFLDARGDICVTKDDQLVNSGSYPSGHSTVSWAAGLILAELAPDRATQILMRARAYGESRVVCGVHYPSDIEAGRTTASAAIAVLHSSPDFRADMDKARAEIAAARAAGPAPEGGQCRIQDEAGAHRPW